MLNSASLSWIYIWILVFMVKLVFKLRMVLSLQTFFQINQDMNKPKLAPLNESGVSELLNKVNMQLLNVWRLIREGFSPITPSYLSFCRRSQDYRRKMIN